MCEIYSPFFQSLVKFTFIANTPKHQGGPHESAVIEWGWTWRFFQSGGGGGVARWATAAVAFRCTSGAFSYVSFRPWSFRMAGGVCKKPPLSVLVVCSHSNIYRFPFLPGLKNDRGAGIAAEETTTLFF